MKNRLETAENTMNKGYRCSCMFPVVPHVSPFFNSDKAGVTDDL